jgi:hypothetical protein
MAAAQTGLDDLRRSGLTDICDSLGIAYTRDQDKESLISAIRAARAQAPEAAAAKRPARVAASRPGEVFHMYSKFKMPLCESCGRFFDEGECPLCKSPLPTPRKRARSASFIRDAQRDAVCLHIKASLKAIERSLATGVELLRKIVPQHHKSEVTDHEQEQKEQADKTEKPRQGRKSKLLPFKIGDIVTFRGKDFKVATVPKDNRHGYTLTCTTNSSYNVTARRRDVSAKPTQEVVAATSQTQ